MLNGNKGETGVVAAHNVGIYADLHIPYPIEGLFTYCVPEGMEIEPCTRVRIDFAGRELTAYVERIHNERPEGFEVKDILGRIDPEPIFDYRLMELAKYTAENYLSSAGEALAMALPSGMRVTMRGDNRSGTDDATTRAITLNAEQRGVYDRIMNSRGTDARAHLIFGITGSGKTEIYIEAAKRMREEGLSVIYLVPEISLSSMFFDRLRSVFGDDLILYHSHLTPNRRLSNWMRFYRGEAGVAVGTRSAVFLQCPRLGMIVIDEENDASYKEHRTPRYNARRLAMYRTGKENALLVMGSATPAVETLYACEGGRVALHTLTRRYGDAALPEVEIVRIASTRPKDILSTPLKLRTRRAVDAKGQVIYLLNRRGFAPIVICNRCGWTVECPECSIAMNFHRERNMLCHYCGRQDPVPVRCGKCGSDDIEKVGTGTQRLEEIIGREFHDCSIFRLDQDSSRKKDTVPDLIEKMKRGEIDILVGTQLVAKGFDFPTVTLVGVLLADIGMNIPDFRSSERIFSLLVQVAGRSGRGKIPGRVIIQTLDPENPLFRFIRRQDYYGFYRSELEARRALRYPPFTRIARLLARGRNRDRVIAAIESVRDALKSRIREGGADITMLGPAAAPLEKIAGNYRHHIILKSTDLGSLRAAVAGARDAVSWNEVYLEVDIDPYDMM